MLEENIIRLPITLSFDSFYNNSFSSYETSSQEGNYHGYKSAHTLQLPCSSFRAIYDITTRNRIFLDENFKQNLFRLNDFFILDKFETNVEQFLVEILE